MPAPAIAAIAAQKAGTAAVKLLDYPVIGVRKQTTRHTKTKTVVTDSSFQLRGWEVLLAALGGTALYIAAVDRGVLPKPTVGGTGNAGSLVPGSIKIPGTHIPGYGDMNLTPLSPLPIELLFPWMVPIGLIGGKKP